MVKNVVCIVCPRSCRLSVEQSEGKIEVKGYGCKRGLEHGISEYQKPMRMLTSTVKIKGGTLPRLPVIGTAEVPKQKLNECLKQVYALEASAPVRCGEVLIADICGTGIDIVASRSMKIKEAE